ncbi:CFS_G0024010.mRNA.1.CDS.1 [Saccharomyces cerevisiae]|nr:CFS_G0024010.mRNA.1.CDS.1 [Saccharomyces cerevisiae]CAI7331652.1 CFS_G0024010.mRNA.1.CDS.1 [Saccharomyces cerevisiae]
MVSEGFLNWTVSPALRRSATRAVAIALVVLSLLLPFVSAPLLYFTSSKKIMRVQLNRTKELSRTTDKNSVADRNEDDETIELEEMGIGSSSQERSSFSCSRIQRHEQWNDRHRARNHSMVDYFRTELLYVTGLYYGQRSTPLI